MRVNTASIFRKAFGLCCLLLCALGASGQGEPASLVANGQEKAFSLRSGDVAAFLGGSDVAAAQFSGHLESLLAAHCAGTALFRNFGWEGDTVFERPREVGFPPLATQLAGVEATFIIAQYGRAEALQKSGSPEAFKAAYARLLRDLREPGRRVVVVTPPPFENPGGALPNLALLNPRLAGFAEAIRQIAREDGYLLVDLFAELTKNPDSAARLPEDGLQLSVQGQARAARACARQAGLGAIGEKAGAASETGAWANPSLERLRLLIVAKNRLWFDYSRPQNWAFLGGDRVSQPSSRDHLNPQIRWFPGEMEKFRPLIEAKEREISALSKDLK